MVLNHIFSRRGEKGGIEYFSPDEVEVTHDADGRITGAVLKSDGKPVDYDGLGTMSKSKRNGVDPQDMIDRYGADTSRFYVMQANPPTDTMIWSDESVEGSFASCALSGRRCTTTRPRVSWRGTRPESSPRN
jgi:leucyl-tRNA synthetase